MSEIIGSEIEVALQETEERYRVLFDSIDEGFCVVELIFEPTGRAVDYRFLETNAAFEQQTGLVNAMGKTMRELAPLHEDHWFETYGRVALTGESVRFEHRAQALGRWFDVFAFQVKPAEARRVGIIFSEISERKKTEEALRASERRFRAVFNQQFQFMAILSPRGEVLEVNELAVRRTGVPREEVLGKLFWETPWWKSLPDMRAAWPQRLAEAAKLEEAILSEDSYQSSDGTVRIAEAATTAVKGPDDHVEFFIIQASDITERKANEARLAEAHSELRHRAEDLERRVEERTLSLNQSLSFLETLLYTIAHDLRAPNRAVQGYSQILLADYGERLDEEARFLLNRISHGALRNEQLIRDLLEFGRLAHTELPCHALNPAAAVRAALTFVEDTVKSVNATIDVSDRWPTVWANDAALNHALINLLSNALKFMPQGVPPRIGVYPKELSPTHQGKGRVRICIEDNGIGIPLDQQERIFKPFQRASSREYEGTGMGLAIARKAVERMKGNVGVISEPGEGSCFWIELQLAEAENSP